MNFKAIFGPVFFSVLAALILYDLLVKGLVGKVFTKNAYDNTFDPAGDARKMFSDGGLSDAERRNALRELVNGSERSVRA